MDDNRLEYEWNLWHGCIKKSEGCKYCYVYSRDEQYDVDSSIPYKTRSFDMPVRRNRSGEYKIPYGATVFTCFTSDFFFEGADEWREEAWDMMRARQDLHFFMTTKRPERFYEMLPLDWGDGWDNVTICCTVENQRRADERLPFYLSLPIKHKQIICEPLLEDIDLSAYLSDGSIECVSVGGESGFHARECRYDWILDIRDQCVCAGVSFSFHQTGANFVKDGKRYKIDKKLHHSQAKAAGIDYDAEGAVLMPTSKDVYIDK